MACERQAGAPDVGHPAPDLDFENPQFIVALPGDTPPRVLAVREIDVQFRVGADVVDITAPLTQAPAIPLMATDDSIDPDADPIWVTYVIRDDAGRALDTGGSMLP